MFEKLGQFASFLQQLPKIKAEVERLQQRLGHMIVDGDAGGGMVKVRASAKLEIVSCTLSDEALRLNDREMLEDLIRAAANQALHKARQLAADETTKVAQGFGLPPGVELPGVGGSMA